MFKQSCLFVVIVLLVVVTAGCQTAEPETVEVPIEVEVTRIVEVPVEQSAPDAHPINPFLPIEFDTIASSATGREYTLTIVLPMSYMMTENDYPAIYVTDGDFYTIPLAMAGSQLAFGQELPEFIIVGVDYGVPDPMEWLGLRDEDMKNGSEKYLQFFEEELVPYIEDNYRVDASNRTLAGHSAGGFFALYGLLFGADTFNNFIASSPSFDKDLPGLDAFAANRGETPARLYLSAGDLDDVVVEDVQTFDEALNEEGFEGLIYETQILDNETHLSARPRAFNNGMRWLFGDNETE